MHVSHADGMESSRSEYHMNQEKKEYLYELIANQLEQDILNDRFQGSKLPSEQELAAQYSCSRAVVREALKVLTERKLVNSVVGSGAYITKPEVSDLSTLIGRLISTHHIAQRDAIDMRIILETSAAEAAAMNATEEELLELKDLHDRLSNLNSLTPDERIKLDYEFHAMISKASHNALLCLVTSAMSQLVFDQVEKTRRAGDVNPLQAKHINHARILHALQERNPVAARSVMYEHIYSANLILEKTVKPEDFP